MITEKGKVTALYENNKVGIQIKDSISSFIIQDDDSELGLGATVEIQITRTYE